MLYLYLNLTLTLNSTLITKTCNLFFLMFVKKINNNKNPVRTIHICFVHNGDQLKSGIFDSH